MEQTTDDRPRTMDGWVEVRNGRGRLLFRLDAGRLLLEVKPKGEAVELVDLRPLLALSLTEVCKKLIDLGAAVAVD